MLIRCLAKMVTRLFCHINVVLTVRQARRNLHQNIKVPQLGIYGDVHSGMSTQDPSLRCSGKNSFRNPLLGLVTAKSNFLLPE